MMDISQLLIPKVQPVTSVSLSDIDYHRLGHTFACTCQMCSNFQSQKINELLQKRALKINNKVANKAKFKHGIVNSHYFWVIKHLGIPNNKIISRGIDAYIPQILFYEDGQASCLFCNKQVDQPVIKRANKQKLSNPFVLKIFGDRRRKYREIINNFFGRKKQYMKKPKFGPQKQVKKQQKQGVIIKYNDGLQHLMSENDFMSLLQRRKQDPVWRQIQYLKNYIPVQNQIDRTIVVKFIRQDIQYEKMFQRAQTLMRVYGENIQKDEKKYISEQEETTFSKSLIAESLKMYAQYLLYKIVCYIEYFYDEKIEVITAKFIINQIDQGYLDQVLRLDVKSLTKFDWTQQTYINKIDEQQQRVLLSKKIEQNQTIQKNASQIESIMDENYEKLKDYYGLSNQEQDNTEQFANNAFFKVLYPDLQHPITEILKGSSMTIDKFRKDFLGYKKKKKSIIRPFTSNMIKSLHNITPQFHKAQSHQYVSVPKRTVSTSFSMRSTFKKQSSLYKSSYHSFSAAKPRTADTTAREWS